MKQGNGLWWAAVVISLAAAEAQPVRVALPEKHGALAEEAVRIFTRRVERQCGGEAEARKDAEAIEVRIRAGIGAEGFTIADGAKGAVRLTADERGVLYGLGRWWPRTCRGRAANCTRRRWRRATRGT